MLRKNARYAGISFDLRRKILSNKMSTPINVIKQYLQPWSKLLGTLEEIRHKEALC